MRTIIAGSRTITNYNFVYDVINKTNIGWMTVIISGGARGVDSLAIRYAKDNKLPYETFIPDWDKYGKKAGIYRNCEMGDCADALIAIWDGASSGTKHMITYAMNLKRIKKIFVVKVDISDINFSQWS